MAVFGEADIDEQLESWGHTIQAQGQTQPCIFDERDEPGDPAGFRSTQQFRRAAVFVKASAFPTLQSEETVVVDGISYIVFNRALVGDGTLRLDVRKA